MKWYNTWRLWLWLCPPMVFLTLPVFIYGAFKTQRYKLAKVVAWIFVSIFILNIIGPCFADYVPQSQTQVDKLQQARTLVIQDLSRIPGYKYKSRSASLANDSTYSVTYVYTYINTFGTIRQGCSVYTWNLKNMTYTVHHNRECY